MPIRYSDQNEDVKLGDRVSINLWFKKRAGRVVYVPGISAMNPEFEYNQMRWVGIKLDNQSLVATPVLSKTETLKRKVRFLRRDESACDFIGPDSREFEKQGEGPAF